jgi:hypothetical protein
MSKLRWAKWFWADWSNDTALNLCSIPARGLWMGLLCIAAQGEPYGTVTIKGRVPTDDELFSLLAPRGTRRRDFNLWLAELEANGVAQRDHRQAIWSPRMSQSGVTSLHRVRAAQRSWKNTATGRNPRNLHEQTRDDGKVLHEQDHSFASTDSRETDSRVPPNPPKGERRAGRMNGGVVRGSEPRNGFTASILADMEASDAEPEADAHSGGATVVPISRRALGG